jgi:hypothetical protein
MTDVKKAPYDIDNEEYYTDDESESHSIKNFKDNIISKINDKG